MADATNSTDSSTPRPLDHPSSNSIALCVRDTRPGDMVRVYLMVVLPARTLTTGHPGKRPSLEWVDAGEFANNKHLTKIVSTWWNLWRKKKLPRHYWSARYEDKHIQYSDVDVVNGTLCNAYCTKQGGIDVGDVVTHNGRAALIVNASGNPLDDKLMTKAMKFIKAPGLPKTPAKPTKRKATPSEQGPDKPDKPDNKKNATAK